MLPLITLLNYTFTFRGWINFYCSLYNKTPDLIIFMCQSTVIKTLTKLTRFGIYRFREVVVPPEVDTLGILLPTLVLNVTLTIISISRTFIQFALNRFQALILQTRQNTHCNSQNKAQNSIRKTNLPIYKGYRVKPNTIHTGTGFSRTVTTAWWNIRDSYTDFPCIFDQVINIAQR